MTAGKKSSQVDSTDATAADETIGYTFCDGCNQGPFCGIKFFKKDHIVTRIDSWPGYPAAPLCS